MASTLLDLTTLLPFVPQPSRHDEPDDDAGADDDAKPADGDAEPDDDAKPVAKPAPKPVAKPKPDDGEAALGDAGKRVLAEARAARKAATAEAATERAAREAAEKRIAEFEDAQRSELEKAQAAAERAAARERAANLRAVSSDIRSFAITGEALDPSDVVDALSRRAADFLTEDGVDADAIEKAVAELLEKKPHWRKPPPVDPDDDAKPATKPRDKPAPKPDPAQGSKGGNGTPDWSDAKTFAAESRRLGLPTYR